MERRRVRQLEHNRVHGIVPRTIIKEVRDLLQELPAEELGPAKGKRGRKSAKSRQGGSEPAAEVPGIPAQPAFPDRRSLALHLQKLRNDMMAAARALDFELAARIRDEVFRLEKLEMEFA
jgi:excinuclease ABC subunit B